MSMSWKFWSGGVRNDGRGSPNDLRCSFCNQPQDAVQRLIAGPAVFICNECLDVCNEIVADDRATTDARPGVQPLVIDGSPFEPELPCSLCGIVTIGAERLAIRERGVLCLGCLGEIEAALAENRFSDLHSSSDSE